MEYLKATIFHHSLLEPILHIALDSDLYLPQLWYKYKGKSIFARANLIACFDAPWNEHRVYIN